MEDKWVFFYRKRLSEAIGSFKAFQARSRAEAKTTTFPEKIGKNVSLGGRRERN
jgi:hypothetical protein